MWVFMFKQKTAYEMRISDWSSDVCSSDLVWVKTENANVDVGGTINVSDNPTPEEMVRRHIQQLVDGGLSFDHIRLVQKVWAAQNNNTSRIRLAYLDRKSTRLNSSH